MQYTICHCRECEKMHGCPQTLIRADIRIGSIATGRLCQFTGNRGDLASFSAFVHQHRRGFGLFGQEAISFDFRWPADCHFDTGRGERHLAAGEQVVPPNVRVELPTCTSL